MLRSPLLPIFLTVFVDVLGLTIVLPLLPFYAEHFGASPLMVGALTATYAACQLVSGPILGRISDRVGRKPTLVVSQCGTFVGFIVLGLAGSLPMLFLGRIIDGCTAGNLTIAQAYISDVTKPENRTKAFALIGIAFGGGFLIGPAISGVMAHEWGFSSPPFAAAALSFLSIVFTSVLLPRVKPVEAPEPSPGRSLAFRRFFERAASRRRLLEFFAYVLAFQTLTGGLALFLERKLHFDVKSTGYVYAFSGLVGGIIQGGIIGRLVKKLGEEKLAIYGFASMAVGYALLGLVNGVPMLLVLIGISGFGIAVTRPAITTMITKSVGRNEQGSALGVSQSLSSIAAIIGPLVAGALIDRGLLTAWGVTAAVFATGGIVLSLQPSPPAVPSSVSG
jgi:MFS family permease